MVDALRILIVDDDWISARVLDKFLGLRGYSTKIVTDSTQAISELREFQPHAVTIDGHMPEVSGCEVAKQIRSEPGFKSITIVSISASDSEDYKASSRAAGVNHHLSKPANIDALCRILSTSLVPAMSEDERQQLETELASVKAQLGAPDLNTDQWRALHEARYALEQRLAADGEATC